MLPVPGNRAGIVKRLGSLTPEIQKYFEHLPKLLEEFPLEVALAYAFARVELAQNMTLYGGIIKLHRGNAELSKNAVNTHHLTREGFEDLFSHVFGKAIKSTVLSALKEAEKVRDKVMHGKNPSEKNIRMAIVRVLEFAESYNEFVNSVAGFKPFDDLRGIKGRATALDKSTTRWVLKGMGFLLS